MSNYPESKIIQITAVVRNNTQYSSALCEDGSVWHELGSQYWSCIVMPLKLQKTIILVGDGEIQYFLNDGWQIIGQAPNPHPQPYIHFSISKNIKLSNKEIEILRDKAKGVRDE